MVSTALHRAPVSSGRTCVSVPGPEVVEFSDVRNNRERAGSTHCLRERSNKPNSVDSALHYIDGARTRFHNNFDTHCLTHARIRITHNYHTARRNSQQLNITREGSTHRFVFGFFFPSLPSSVVETRGTTTDRLLRASASVESTTRCAIYFTPQTL